MPIVDFLPDNDVVNGLPRIAKIRKGEPKQVRKRPDGSTYEVVGRDQDHFRVEFEPEYKHLEPIFVKLSGDRPKSIGPVMFMVNTAPEALDFWKEDWNATTLLHRCDSKEQHVWYHEQIGRYMRSRQLCAAPACQCKPVGRLNLILPNFTIESGFLGYFTVETHSEEDIRTLYRRLAATQAMYGGLRGIPFEFYREKRKTSAPQVTKQGERTGKRMNVLRSLLDIRVEPDFTRKRLMAALTGNFTALPDPMAMPNEMPALPEQAPVSMSEPAPTEDAHEARQALNGGGRRIGTPATPWTANKKRWDGFVKWGSLHGLSEEQSVLTALDNVADHDIKSPSDWTGDEVTAMAAVIALVCDYDTERIEKVSTGIEKEEVSEAVRARALQLSAMISDEEIEEAETEA